MQISILDKAIIHIDNLLRAKSICANSPADKINAEEALSLDERRNSVSMLRVNHSGEVCAQALYQGQALMTKSIKQYNALIKAAGEENDHLQWCSTRLQELNGRPSILNPIWYVGSFGIGALAGMAGDKISMGFLAETEYQVSEHLNKHLAKMSVKDKKSRAILQQMREDELRHATTAEKNGAVELPLAIKILMRATSKILTITASKI